MFEFEDILSDVMKELKTEYFKNDIVMTMQITKFLLMSNPKKFVDVLYSTLSPAMIRPERLAEMLERDVLNRRTRKPFIDSLMQQEKIGRVYKKELKAKEDTPLVKFFG